MGIAQNPIDRVDPPCWWAEMKNPDLQLLIHGEQISGYDIKIDYPGVTLCGVDKVESTNYVFLNLKISQGAVPGIIHINFFRNGKVQFTQNYELLERQKGSAERKSFTPSDVIYLIMPDRFANGDTTNDSVVECIEKADRSNPGGRHGGDIQGVIDHLDYIKNMGFTAIWLNPVQSNNLPKSTYHGYAISDYYKIDNRLGSNELYRKLSEECKKKGLKLIMDVVTNHTATDYFWMKDLPSKDWLNDYPNYSISNFRGILWSDPYCSKYDLHKMASGWFDHSMADLNHQNQHMANYLIQNTIWWVEYAGLDGLRSDTHMYNDRDFISDWAKAISYEYSNLNLVGEVWLKQTSQVSYWQKDSKIGNGFNSYLPALMDFPLYFSVEQAFNELEGWETGMARLYNILSEDFVYPDPNNLVLITDNHDVSRIYSTLGEDIDKFKMAIAFLTTIRGIPQFYYGSELAFSGSKQNGDPDLRKDFPGGWKDDLVNGFTEQGLSSFQIDVQEYIRKLLNWRKNSDAVAKGRLKHYIPENGIYVYFRFSNNNRVMVILNNNSESKTIDTKRYQEMLEGYTSWVNVLTGEISDNLYKISLKGKSATILELK